MTSIGESACVSEPLDVGVAISIRFQIILCLTFASLEVRFLNVAILFDFSDLRCFNLSLAVFRCLLFVFVTHSAGPG